MRELVKSFLDWYLGALDAGGYPLIAFLMALESSIVPLPSEVVIPPAAYSRTRAARCRSPASSWPARWGRGSARR